MQASLVALVAALAGILLEKFGQSVPFISILGTALIMGAFVVAITAFLLFVKKQVFGPSQDEIMWSAGR
ncbi:MAG: hypothetical protein GYA23_07475 [Methanomicrobiales archaeon]|nr:hypothetical protein [Methanomicrobiales archaeon]